MKKVFALIVLIMSFLCTGCVKYSYDIDINSKDEVCIKEEKLINYTPLKHKKFRNLLYEDLKDVITTYTDAGYSVKTFQSGEEAGGVITKGKMSFGKAEKNLPKGFNNVGERVFTTSRGIIKKNYKVHFLYKLEDTINDDLVKNVEFREKSQIFQQYGKYLPDYIWKLVKGKTFESGSQIIYKYYVSGRYEESFDSEEEIRQNENCVNFQSGVKIRIPKYSKIIKHNADNKISDNELYWDLSNSENGVNVYLEYERNDFSIVSALLSIAIFIYAVFALQKRLSKGSPVKGL